MKTRIGAILPCLVITLIALAFTSSHAQSGSLAPNASANPVGIFEPMSATGRKKGEVDFKLAELSSRREVVLFVCAEASKCKPLKKGQHIAGHLIKEMPKRGQPINLPTPTYPPMARAAHASGTVGIQVLIDEEGKVIAAQAVSGHPLLHAAALKAARQATFTPMLIDGKPFKLAGVIDYSFSL